jgi:hypothetical protein
MLKPIAYIALMALWSASFQQGCEDAKKSVTHLKYYPIRDMRQSWSLDPQRDAWGENGPRAVGPGSRFAERADHGRDPYLADIGNYEASARSSSPARRTRRGTRRQPVPHRVLELPRQD